MSRQEAFERHYAEQHDVPVESMAQYRWAEKDGYRLPGISAAYRNYCASYDQANSERTAHVSIEIPPVDLESLGSQIQNLIENRIVRQ